MIVYKPPFFKYLVVYRNSLINTASVDNIFTWTDAELQMLAPSAPHATVAASLRTRFAEDLAVFNAIINVRMCTLLYYSPSLCSPSS